LFYFIAIFILLQLWFHMQSNKISACFNSPAKACNKINVEIKEKVYFIATLISLLLLFLCNKCCNSFERA